jgi:F0F1-type ATP synthase assembly protein I
VTPTRRALITDTAVVLTAGTAVAGTALSIGIPAWVITLAAAIPTLATAIPLWLIHHHAEQTRRAIDQATTADQPAPTHTIHPRSTVLRRAA